MQRREVFRVAAGALFSGRAAVPAATQGPPEKQNFLLVDSSEIAEAKRKAKTYPWAGKALDKIRIEAEQALRDPVQIPDRGGQWPHWYSCKVDGEKLVTISPTEHRCPVCGRIYHGDPYDAVVLYYIHSRYSQAVQNLGLAYRFFGRKEFARRAAEILVGYADRYRSYPRHDINGRDTVRGGKVMAQTLDESVWLIPIAWGYSLISETLSQAQRRHIEADLLTAAADVIREHRMGIHNIQCWKNSAVGLAGFVTGNQELVHEAIDDPDRGFRVQIARGVTDDGLWFEGSLGYHRYTMVALLPLTEAARHARIDLYSERMRHLFDAPLELSFPNGDSPGFNDAGFVNLYSFSTLYEIAYARWNKPAYGHLLAHAKRASLQALLYGADEVSPGPVIPTESQLLRSAGYAMLRANGTVAAVRFGMHGGGHGHPDKLNVVTFGAGQQFGLDPGSINYGVPLHREWYRSTIAHNTVSVDQQLQKNEDGALDEWKAGSGFTTLRTSAGTVYPGVNLRRSLKLTAGRLEDRFECSSESEHVYDWVFHALGSFDSSLVFHPRGSLGDSNGYQHIEKVGGVRSDDDWWARWATGSARFTLRVKGAPGTEVFAGVGPGRDPADRVPMIVIRRRGRTALFEMTHEFASAS